MIYPHITSGPVAETTPNGTAYNRLYYNETGDEAVLLTVPTAAEPLPSVTLVIGCHGYGGSFNSWNDHPPFLGTRDAVNDQGWVFAAPNMHGNQWGNTVAMDDLARVYSYVSGLWTIDQVILIGGSMGGLTVLNALIRSVVPDVVAVITIAAVVDLGAAHSIGSYQASIRTAYGVASDGSDFTSKTTGFNPVLAAAASWADKVVDLYHSSSDTAITLAAHSQALKASGKLNGARFSRLTVTTGPHLDAANFNIPQSMALAVAAVAGTLPVASGQPAQVVPQWWDGVKWRQVPSRTWDGTGWVPAVTTVYL